ncbi:hypothetical protein T484DRAFT_1888899, partial [Baffinella frigidus]
GFSAEQVPAALPLRGTPEPVLRGLNETAVRATGGACFETEETHQGPKSAVRRARHAPLRERSPHRTPNTTPRGTRVARRGRSPGRQRHDPEGAAPRHGREPHAPRRACGAGGGSRAPSRLLVNARST